MVEEIETARAKDKNVTWENLIKLHKKEERRI